MLEMLSSWGESSDTMFIIEIKADKKTGVSNYQVAEQLSTLSYLTDHFNFYNISLHCPCKIFLHSYFSIYVASLPLTPYT